MKKKVLVEGPVLSRSGYGEHARFVLRSLRSQEDIFDIYAMPLNWGQTSWLFEEDEERKWIDSIINKTVHYVQQQGQFDIYCHVGIPNELKRKAPLTIEITAGIETTKVTPEWIDICNRECDKIITVSEHSKKVFENTNWKAQDQFGRQLDLKLNVPIEVVGYPVKEFKQFDNYKEWLTLDYDFNFLCVAQWGPRKNLPNTIRWFLEEFKNDNVGLICKVNYSNNSILDRSACENTLHVLLKDFPDRKCKIYLLHGDMTEDEVHNLYVHPQIKAIVNFGHGEGFGLPLFEAAYCGLPVIAPDYSGQKDFLYMELDGKKKKAFTNVPFYLKKIQQEAVWNGVLHAESEWAFVKPFGAKSAMRECYKDYGRFKGQAKKLKDYILNNNQNLNKKLSNSILGKINIQPQDFNGISFCIITNGKNKEKTDLEIKSIKNTMNNSNKNYEIIIAGNVSEFFEDNEITLVNTPEDAKNGLLGKLRNNAGEKAKFDLIVFVDDDFIFPKIWFQNLNKFSTTNGFDVLSNKIFNPDGTRFWDRATMDPHTLVDYDYPEISTNLYQTGGFWIIRKKVFDKIKWNSEFVINSSEKGLSHYNEDIDYTFKMYKNGYRLIFDKNNLVWHNDDKYTQWENQTLKKELISKKFEIDFFADSCEEFNILKEIL